DSVRGRAAQAGFIEGAEVVIGEDIPLIGDRSLSETGAKVGFHLLPPLGSLVELTGERDEEVEGLFRALGFHPEWVADAPGLVLGRMPAQLVNEATLAFGEEFGSPEGVDEGLTYVAALTVTPCG